NGRTVFEIKGIRLIHIRREELAGRLELVNVCKAILNIGGGDLGVVGVALGQGGGGGRAAVAGVQQRDRVIGHIVHRVHAAAVHIEHNVVSVELVLVNHRKLLYS